MMHSFSPANVPNLGALAGALCLGLVGCGAERPADALGPPGSP